MGFIKDIWNDEKSSIGEKVGFTILTPFIVTAEKICSTKWGNDIASFFVKQQEKDEKLKEEHPGLWAAKKLAEGTAKGLFGIPFTKD